MPFFTSLVDTGYLYIYSFHYSISLYSDWILLRIQFPFPINILKEIRR